MAEIIFSLNGRETMMQCSHEDKMKEIFEKFAMKAKKDIDTLSFLYGGDNVNGELTLNELIKNDDKIKILVIENKKDIIVGDNEGIVKSKEIICPKCNENCMIKIKNYKISLFGCKNGDISDNILLENFEKTQNINIANIICDKCEKTNKYQAYENKFYKCLICDKNLCPLCNISHYNIHQNIINYEQKNYICSIHKESYISYCNSCKINMCIQCEIEHNRDHDIISFKNLVVNKGDIMKKMEEFNLSLNKFNDEAKNIIKMLNKIMDNFKIYYDIIYDIVNNYNVQNKNYENFQNINYIYNNIPINDIKDILSEYNNDIKMSKIIDIYNKMTIKDFLNENNNENINENNNEKINEKIKEKIKEKIDENIDENIVLENNNNINNGLEIDYNTLTHLQSSIEGLQFFNINEKGKIDYSAKYNKKSVKDFILQNSFYISFCFKYKNIWYPLIKNNGLVSKWNGIYFEDWKEIKKQAEEDFDKWVKKIKTINNAYQEISTLYEFKCQKKSDKFFKDCQSIIRRNILIGMESFRKQIFNFNANNNNKDLVFENIIYFLLHNENNIFQKLFNCFTKEIQDKLINDYKNYLSSSNNSYDKTVFLYNYIIKINDIFIEKEEEFNKNGRKIMVDPADIN